MQFSIASFNLKNLIGPDREYYRFQSYTPEEYAWKRDWMADQLVDLDADVIGFQEVFEERLGVPPPDPREYFHQEKERARRHRNLSPALRHRPAPGP